MTEFKPYEAPSDLDLDFTPAPPPDRERMERPDDEPVEKVILEGKEPIRVVGTASGELSTAMALQVTTENAAYAFMWGQPQTIRTADLDLPEEAIIPEGTVFAIMVSSSEDGIIPVRVTDWLVRPDVSEEAIVTTDFLFQRGYKAT